MTRERWNGDRGGNEQMPNVDAFLEEVIEVCKKHRMSIAHEDTHGGFVVRPYTEWITGWFLEASTSGVKSEGQKELCYTCPRCGHILTEVQVATAGSRCPVCEISPVGSFHKCWKAKEDLNE